MKKFKNVSDSELLSQIKIDAQTERHAGLAVIDQLREVARRRLDAQLGYSSLFVYCTDELLYSPGSAQRRVQAVKALGELPEFETKILTGELTLASLSQVQGFCDSHDKSSRQKKEILEKVTGKSKRETAKLLAELAPQPVKKDTLKPRDKEQSELRVTLSDETVSELEKIRDLISHSHPGASYSEVIAYLAKLGLKKLDPTQTQGRAPKVSPPGEQVSVSSKRAVWKRDGSQCGYAAPSGKVCGSTAFLQIDHVIPRAKGGSNDPSNLRLRCQTHNLFAAVQEYGETKMSCHLSRD